MSLLVSFSKKADILSNNKLLIPNMGRNLRGKSLKVNKRAKSNAESNSTPVKVDTSCKRSHNEAAFAEQGGSAIKVKHHQGKQKLVSDRSKTARAEKPRQINVKMNYLLENTSGESTNYDRLENSLTCVTVCFGTPVLPADLFVLSPGYEVPPDLATVPPPFSMRSLRLRCP